MWDSGTCGLGACGLRDDGNFETLGRVDSGACGLGDDRDSKLWDVCVWLRMVLLAYYTVRAPSTE